MSAGQCTSSVTFRSDNDKVVRCGKVVGHDGPHLTVTGQDQYVEWQTVPRREGAT